MKLYTYEETKQYLEKILGLHYLYIIYNPITKKPVYIGKGTWYRVLEHRKRCLNKSVRGKYFINYLRKQVRNGYEPLYRIEVYSKDEGIILSKEKELIKKYGRKRFDKGGILYNLSLGADGKGALSQTEVIDRITEKHKELFNAEYLFDKFVYTRYGKPVQVGCKIHGYWWTSPDSMLSYQRGCPDCGKKRRDDSNRLTQETIINRAKQVWGDRYDYSETKYIDDRTPIYVHCNRCDEGFSVTQYNHIKNKSGCPDCAIEMNALNRRALSTRKYQEKLNKMGFETSMLEGKALNVHTDRVKLKCPICEHVFRKTLDQVNLKIRQGKSICPKC